MTNPIPEWERQLREQEVSVFWKDAVHCVCFAIDPEKGQTKELPERLIDFIRTHLDQARKEGYFIAVERLSYDMDFTSEKQRKANVKFYRENMRI